MREEWLVTAEVSDDEQSALVELLRRFNEPHIGRPHWQPLNLVARDRTGAIVGGLIGETGAGWLSVYVLVVAAERRGQGLGARLLRDAEHIARERGCIGAQLDTLDFQALDFYLAQGYEEFGLLQDSPPGRMRHYLQKRLLASR